MEPLIEIGRTQQTVRTFGRRRQPHEQFVDSNGTQYCLVSNQYKEAVFRTRFFRNGLHLDFKLKRARGRVWPEAPRLHSRITFYNAYMLNEEDVLFHGRVSYVDLERKRSVGMVVVEDVQWVHPVQDAPF